MGLILDTRSGRLVTLSPRALVGRSPACQIRIDDPRASAEHASIAWAGDCWEVRDLGSLNGTWLGGRRLGAGDRAALAHDARLGFGSAAEPWILADAAPPGPAARNELTATLVHSTSGLLALPSAEDPRATICGRADGSWIVELGAGVRAIADLDRLELDGATWTVYLPDRLGALPATLKSDGTPYVLDEIGLSFAPSLDEEHVDLRVIADDVEGPSLPPRSSHYILLVLARARLRDARDGVALDEQGWLYSSALADMLRCTPERLNVDIFRARNQFAKLGFVDSGRLIERRPSTRQIRIGVARLRVTRP